MERFFLRFYKGFRIKTKFPNAMKNWNQNWDAMSPNDFEKLYERVNHLSAA